MMWVQQYNVFGPGLFQGRHRPTSFLRGVKNARPMYHAAFEVEFFFFNIEPTADVLFFYRHTSAAALGFESRLVYVLYVLHKTPSVSLIPSPKMRGREVRKSDGKSTSSGHAGP